MITWEEFQLDNPFGLSKSSFERIKPYIDDEYIIVRKRTTRRGWVMRRKYKAKATRKFELRQRCFSNWTWLCPICRKTSIKNSTRLLSRKNGMSHMKKHNSDDEPILIHITEANNGNL